MSILQTIYVCYINMIIKKCLQFSVISCDHFSSATPQDPHFEEVRACERGERPFEVTYAARRPFFVPDQ
jgi:hypothetical protein